MRSMRRGSSTGTAASSSAAEHGRSYPGPVPEGDTIFRSATVLRRALAGRRVLGFEAPRVRPQPFREGTTVTTVEARGKHLLIGFDDGRVLHTHMQMSGSWHVYEPSMRWRRPHAQMRVRIDVPEATAVCFNAPVVELLRERDLARHPRLAALGPDLCSPEADLDEAMRRLAAMPGSTETGVLLLDQRIACGIGNVYKSEVLFARRVDPFAPLSSLEPADRRALYDTAGRMLRANLDGGRRMTAPGGLAVYGKAGRPCPRCGTAIASRRQGESARTTYWCPSCQSSAA
jgi:endonuclease VIII